MMIRRYAMLYDRRSLEWAVIGESKNAVWSRYSVAQTVLYGEWWILGKQRVD